MGRFANASNLLAQRRRFVVEPEAATRPIDEMEQIVKTRWRPIACAEGSTEQDCERISGAFAYAGLRQ